MPPWYVVMACRNASKAETAIADIRRIHREAHVRFVPLDLFSLASVRQFPALLGRLKLPPLAGLILNAGGPNMNGGPRDLTEDGFERTFQLNFFGHFLLANLLLGELTAGSRIILVSSDLHDPAATKAGRIMAPKFGPVEDLARASGTAAKLKPITRYATAKLYAMMTAFELDRRLKAANKPITVNAWSPGVVPTTQAGQGMNPLAKRLITSRWFVNFMGSHLSTEEEAAHALGDLLINPKYEGVGGKYIDGFKEIPSSAESRDERKARSVWEQSSRLAGLAIDEIQNPTLSVASDRPTLPVDFTER
jgi:NAD(P)-dependent dehydrogenase (short-subunit alcohol dehydrogenase family)